MEIVGKHFQLISWIIESWKKEKLIESVSEKQRIKRLFGSKVRIDRSNLNLLGDACDSILDKYNQEKVVTDAEKLYSLRCMLIHRCYILDSVGVKLINDVNDGGYPETIGGISSRKLQSNYCLRPEPGSKRQIAGV